MRNGQPTIEQKIFDEAGVGWRKINGVWHRAVTSVLGETYPKGKRLLEWMVKNGANSESIRDDAAVRGGNVHKAMNDLIRGITLKRDHFPKDEWKHLCSFVNWYEDKQPKILAVEEVVYSTTHRLAGQLDLRAEIDGEEHVVDLKTGSYLYPVNSVQVQTYSHLKALMGHPVPQTGLLRTGSRHKRGYEWMVRPYDPDVFDAVMVPALELFDHAADSPHEPILDDSPETLRLPSPERSTAPSRNGRAKLRVGS